MPSKKIASPSFAGTTARKPALRVNPPPKEKPGAGWPILALRREQELPIQPALPLRMVCEIRVIGGSAAGAAGQTLPQIAATAIVPSTIEVRWR